MEHGGKLTQVVKHGPYDFLVRVSEVLAEGLCHRNWQGAVT